MRVKGQANAPIEILLAVILLSMGLAIAFNVMKSSGDYQCKLKIKASSENLKLAVQTVNTGYAGTAKEIEYQAQRCGSISVDALRFAFYNQPAYCGDCAGHYSSCWKIEPLQIFKDSEGSERLEVISDAALCIDMPGDVWMELMGTPEDEEGNEVGYAKACPPNFKSDCNNATADAPISIPSVSPHGGGGGKFTKFITFDTRHHRYYRFLLKKSTAHITTASGSIPVSDIQVSVVKVK